MCLVFSVVSVPENWAGMCGAKVWRGHRGNTGASDLRCDKLKEDSAQFCVDSTLALLS